MSPGNCAACSTGMGICSAHRDTPACYRCGGSGVVKVRGHGTDVCPRCHDGAQLGEQSLSAEELEIDRLRADNRHMREALVSISCRASDPFCARIAIDTLKRVMT